MAGDTSCCRVETISSRGKNDGNLNGEFVHSLCLAAASS